MRMRPAVRGFRVLMVAAALVFAACGSSKTTNTPNAPATTGSSATSAAPPATSQPTPTSPTTQSNATTPCTIPQNNGGDHDADNNGAPSDGDGCDR